MIKKLLLAATALAACSSLGAEGRPRVIVTSDGEIDDECSMVRFLLYANEFDVEGIVTSKAEGEMEQVTAGSQHIVKVLLDETDDRPVWLQAWGGPNTIARALTEAGTYDGTVEIRDREKQDAAFVVPENAVAGETIHLVGEVTDRGKPPLTRYRRVVATVGR